MAWEVTSRVDRAGERLRGLIKSMPEALRMDAEMALGDLIQAAKSEVADAYGDGYRIRKDEEVMKSATRPVGLEEKNGRLQP
jgi:hypothetical protein